MAVPELLMKMMVAKGKDKRVILTRKTEVYLGGMDHPNTLIILPLPSHSPKFSSLISKM